MARLTDGSVVIEIEMIEGNGCGLDWSADFFEVGGLEYIEWLSAYKVDDLSYCIEQAEDWKNSTGDYSMFPVNEGNEVFWHEC